MTEFISKVGKNGYAILFQTDKWSDYAEVQETIRGIIDRNKTQILSRYMDTCGCCGAEIPEGQQIFNECEKSVTYGKDM